MRRLALAIIAALALAAPVSAGEQDMDVIEDAIQAAIDDRSELPALAAIVGDENTPPACRYYADLAVVMIELIDLGWEYTDSLVTQHLFEAAQRLVPQVRNDCLLAI